MVGGMSQPRPTVYLLMGLPGSGKSTFARALELTGVVRLSVDDRMTELHGRFGKDYPEDEYFALLEPVVNEMRSRLIKLVQAGCSVVLDHSLRRRAEREEYKCLVVENGGVWRLIHFKVDAAELMRRLEKRNADPAYWFISPETLALIVAYAQDPEGEGEESPDGVADGTHRL
jgi:predicted kinase